MSSDGAEPTAADESLFLTYVVPFFGVLLIAIGLPLSVLGGYVVVQDTLGLCGNPVVEVRALEGDERPATTVDDLPFDDLSAAERTAVEAAVDSPLEEARIDGELANEEALMRGVIVEVDGERYYVRIASLDTCLDVEPLLFPVGAIAILVGIAGVLTPPIYRKMAGFEERMRDREPRQ